MYSSPLDISFHCFSTASARTENDVSVANMVIPLINRNKNRKRLPLLRDSSQPFVTA